jgi:SAM-dependent methyltransferase
VVGQSGEPLRLEDAVSAESPRYVTGQRERRLAPSLLSSRYHFLTPLARQLRATAAELPIGEAILDFGCAERPYESVFVPRFSKYIGADIARNHRADITITPDGRVPLGDRSVDAVLSTQVLEHVANPHAYLVEAWRLLRPVGHLVLSTHGVWRYHPDPGDYWRWTLDGLTLELRRARFDTVRVRSVLGATAAALQLLRDPRGVSNAPAPPTRRPARRSGAHRLVRAD